MSKSKDNDILDSVIYNYSTMSNKIEEENRVLKETINKLKEELERFREPPLMVSEIMNVLDDGKAIIRIPNGNQFYVNVSEDCTGLKAGDMVLTDQKNLNVVSKTPVTRKFNIEQFVIIENPTVSWNDVGGLDRQINEVKEVVELPLKKPELFKKMGISPPKGILLYGTPGNGKTLIAKAVAASTKSTFIEVVGSELVQKFIGEGAKLVKEIFELAKKKAPAIIFIDEIDSLAARRVEIGTSGEREVNRTFMQLLAEVDGFETLGNVKVIGATNRKDILDPAILRPGRLDRLIRISEPNKEARKEIFKIHSKEMKLYKNVKIQRLVDLMDGFSGAEIKAACTEAGYFAIRDSRFKVKHEDFTKAINKVKQEEKLEGEDYIGMFG